MKEENKSVSKKVLLVLLSAAVIFLIAFPIVKVMNSSYSVVIKDKEMNYFRAGNLFICGDTIICRKDSETAKDKSKLPAEDISRYSYKILSMKDIISIEIVLQDEVAEIDSSAVNIQYTGKYKIHLQGHEGILVLGVSKERVYGTLRFPDWGRGAVENLKGIKTGSGEVKFIRSASTAEEIRRLGANYLFKQTFSGKYSVSGKVIKGIMVNDRGEKHEWEAVKK